MFLDPIKNRVSVKSMYVEAVYLEALLYSQTLDYNLLILVTLISFQLYWNSGIVLAKYIHGHFNMLLLY